MIKQRAVYGSLVAVCVALLFAAGAHAVTVEKLEDLNNYAADYDNIKVTVTAVVRSVEPKTAPNAASFYTLRDDTADNIRVRYGASAPNIGERYTVSGVWTRSANDAGDPVYFIAEETRESFSAATNNGSSSTSQPESSNPASTEKPAESAPTAAGTPANTQAPGELEEGSTLWIWIVVALLLFLLLVAAVFFALNRKKPEVEVDPMSRTSRVPTSNGDIERTMKVENDKVAFHVPEVEMTMGVVPGKLSVVQGDDLGEIRLYRTGGEPMWTFGREPGQPLRHFQIKDPTVSRQHATLRYMDSRFRLTNHSHTNPVIVNGEAVAVDGSIDLEDQAVIMLGDVTLKFFEVKVN